MGTEPAREHRQVDHQRRIREHQLGEVDDEIRLGTKSTGQRGPASSLRRSVLVPANTQNRRFGNEIDDPRNLPKSDLNVQASDGFFIHLVSMVSIEDVNDALREVIDPELGLDFVELGLIYEVSVDGGTVHVSYTLTSPGCPIGPQVAEQIEEFVGELEGVEDVQPTMTFTPPWTPELMSEDAKFALGF